MCSFVPFTQSVSVFVSSFTMTAIAVDRYKVISTPLHVRAEFRDGYWKVAIIWCLSVLLSIPWAVYHSVKPTFTCTTLIRCQVRFIGWIIKTIEIENQYPQGFIKDETIWCECISTKNRFSIHSCEKMIYFQGFLRRSRTLHSFFFLANVEIHIWKPNATSKKHISIYFTDKIDLKLLWIALLCFLTSFPCKHSGDISNLFFSSSSQLMLEHGYHWLCSSSSFWYRCLWPCVLTFWFPIICGEQARVHIEEPNIGKG